MANVQYHHKLYTWSTTHSYSAYLYFLAFQIPCALFECQHTFTPHRGTRSKQNWRRVPPLATQTTLQFKPDHSGVVCNSPCKRKLGRALFILQQRDGKEAEERPNRVPTEEDPFQRDAYGRHWHGLDLTDDMLHELEVQQEHVLLANSTQILRQLEGTGCPDRECKGVMMVMEMDVRSQNGGGCFTLECDVCKKEELFNTGMRHVYNGAKGEKVEVGYEGTLFVLGQLLNGGYVHSIIKQARTMGLPSINESFIRRILKALAPAMEKVAEEGMELVRRRVEERGDSQQWATQFDGSWGHRGYFSPHGSAAIHDDKEKGVAWAGNVSREGPTKEHPDGHYDGTSNSMESYLITHLLHQVAARGWKVSTYVADGDGGSAEQARILGDAAAVACANHTSKNVTKGSAAIGDKFKKHCSCPFKRSKNGCVLTYKDHIGISAVEARKVGRRVSALLSTETDVELFKKKVNNITKHLMGVCDPTLCCHPQQEMARSIVTCETQLRSLQQFLMTNIVEKAESLLIKSPDGKRMTTNLSERLHSVAIHYRNKDIHLGPWHYVLKTQMSICHVNQLSLNKHREEPWLWRERVLLEMGIAPSAATMGYLYDDHAIRIRRQGVRGTKEAAVMRAKYRAHKAGRVAAERKAQTKSDAYLSQGDFSARAEQVRRIRAALAETATIQHSEVQRRARERNEEARMREINEAAKLQRDKDKKDREQKAEEARAKRAANRQAKEKAQVAAAAERTRKKAEKEAAAAVNKANVEAERIRVIAQRAAKKTQAVAAVEAKKAAAVAAIEAKKAAAAAAKKAAALVVSPRGNKRPRAEMYSGSGDTRPAKQGRLSKPRPKKTRWAQCNSCDKWRETQKDFSHIDFICTDVSKTCTDKCDCDEDDDVCSCQ